MTSPYQAPTSNLVNVDDRSTLQSYKRYVISDPEAQWPGRCYKCNEPASVKKNVKLYYLNPWWYLTILIAWVVTVVIYFVARKKFVVDLPMCERHQRKRKNFILIQWGLIVLFFIGLVGSIVTAQDPVVLFTIVVFLCLVITAIASRLIVVVKFKNEKLWISGAGKPFVNSLPAADSV